MKLTLHYKYTHTHTHTHARARAHSTFTRIIKLFEQINTTLYAV